MRMEVLKLLLLLLLHQLVVGDLHPLVYGGRLSQALLLLLLLLLQLLRHRGRRRLGRRRLLHEVGRHDPLHLRQFSHQLRELHGGALVRAHAAGEPEKI